MTLFLCNSGDRDPRLSQVLSVCSVTGLGCQPPALGRFVQSSEQMGTLCTFVLSLEPHISSELGAAMWRWYLGSQEDIFWVIANLVKCGLWAVGPNDCCVLLVSGEKHEVG